MASIIGVTLVAIGFTSVVLFGFSLIDRKRRREGQ